MKKLKVLNASHLKLIAMACMLLDHMWATVMDGNLWMTCVGRIAFPIFAFQVAEGYAHTKNFKKYLLRMFLFALIAEIPFNLMAGGWWFYPFGQNVMFTFCLALLLIRLIDKARAKHWALGLAAAAVGAFVGYWVGMFTFVDYYGYGILMVLVFWLFREMRLGWLVTLAAMIYINFEMIGGMHLEVFLFGRDFLFPQQGFAVLALIPIWLYNGEQGIKSKAFQYACYAFYPVHMLILALTAMLL